MQFCVCGWITTMAARNMTWSSSRAAREYDYSIDALTGEVLSMDRDAEYYNGAAQAASGSYIGEAAAQQAALAHAGLDEASVSFVRTHLDWDDGRWKYEVEFYKDSTEYDYDIDAVTGDVLSYDYDAEYYTAPTAETASGAGLTADQAKQIAPAARWCGRGGCQPYGDRL